MDFKDKIDSTAIGHFRKTFNNNDIPFIYSVLHFIETTHLCHIIETCMYKKIYSNTLHVNETLALGQKVEELFSKIDALKYYETSNTLEEECVPGKIDKKFIDFEKTIRDELKKLKSSIRYNNYKFFEFVTNPFVNNIEKIQHLEQLLQKPGESNKK